MDLSAPILAGSFEAAVASVDCALSGAQAIVAGESAVFALCRPPGHHAGRDTGGGYCYFNNAAIAANWLSARERVAILDIDYHGGIGKFKITSTGIGNIGSRIRRIDIPTSLVLEGGYDQSSLGTNLNGLLEHFS